MGMLLDGISGREVSKQLGVNQGVLYRWKAEKLEQIEAMASAVALSPKGQL